MPAPITLLRPHLRHECFAVVRCGTSWELRLLVDNVVVRQEAIPGSFADALIEAACAEG